MCWELYRIVNKTTNLQKRFKGFVALKIKRGEKKGKKRKNRILYYVVTSEQDRGLECDLDSKAASATDSNVRTHTEKEEIPLNLFGELRNAYVQKLCKIAGQSVTLGGCVSKCHVHTKDPWSKQLQRTHPNSIMQPITFRHQHLAKQRGGACTMWKRTNGRV